MDDSDPLSSPAPLRAPAFEVAGEDGRVRARLGLATDGSLALDLADADGLVRATLVVEPGGSAALKLADARGSSASRSDRGSTTLRRSTSTMPGATTGSASGSGPAVPPGYRSGTARASCARCTPRARRPSANARWSSSDRDGAYRAGTCVWPDGGTGLELLDERGTLRARLGQRADVGAPTIELYGADGAFRAAMGEYPDGAGRVNLWDADGLSIAE